jgi:hypothetical protein
MLRYITVIFLVKKWLAKKLENTTLLKQSLFAIKI